ncbi:MAG: hypothetical protein AB1938_15130 [Myxococcota bacterium]
MLRLSMLLALLAAPALAEGPQRVTVGVHLRNAEAVSLEQNAYSLSFVMWMRWKGELDPTKSFRFVNLLEAWALTSTPVFDEPLVEADGSRYQRFVVEGRFFHKFDLRPYPLDWQKLVLELEDVRHDSGVLEYVADEQSSVVEPLSVPGWTPVSRILEVAPFTYPGGLGRADAKPFSRFRFGVKLQRPLRLLLLTMAPPVLLVLLCCFAVFFLRPLHVEARVGTVITALLTVVFLQLAFTDDLPYLGNSVLLDQLFNLSYVLMTAVLLECVVVTRLFDRAKDLEAQAATQEGEAQAATRAKAEAVLQRISRLDRWAARGFPPLYALGCLVIVLLARGAQVAAVPF